MHFPPLKPHKMGGATRFLSLLTTAAATTPSSSLLLHPSPPLLRFHRHRRLHSSSLPFLTLLPSHPKPFHHHLYTQTAAATSSSSSSVATDTWPEWNHFIQNLSAAGYLNNNGISSEIGNEFVASSEISGEFVEAASACLAFAYDRPDILGMVSRRDIEVVVENGTPFLFKNGDDSARRMRMFLGINRDCNVLSDERAQTIDLMRFLLSYASNHVSSEKNSLHNRELVESSVRNLLGELAQLSYNASASNLSGFVHNHFPDRQIPSPVGTKIEMKRGDWICPRCSFMNFARNVKCLECEEARPKRQLSGGEWECPQCDFFNYARNAVCLRCDCKRPGEISLGDTSSRLGLGYRYGSRGATRADMDSRLAANEEKAQRWFSKVSQLDSMSDMSSAIADEDFPEIMPLRKGVNRFVVSTRKTPLERRLASAQQRQNMGNDGTAKGDGRTSYRSLDEILGRKSVTSESHNRTFSGEQNVRTDAPLSSSGGSKESNSNYAPFVPPPKDMFAKRSYSENEDVKTDDYASLPSSTSELTVAASGSNGYDNLRSTWQPSEKSMSQTPGNENEKEQGEKSERWLKRVAELHNVTDLTGLSSDENFPEIMPMYKGENQFVVSKKKDRSLTSPTYKRHMAMEQANNTNYVPFVPFPPNYFAKKDNQQQDGEDSIDDAMDHTSNSATLEKLNDAKTQVPDASHVQGLGNQQDGHTTGTLKQTETDANFWASTSRNSTQNVSSPSPVERDGWGKEYPRNMNGGSTPNLMVNSLQNSTAVTNPTDSVSSGYPWNEKANERKNLSESPIQPSESVNIRDSWTGKSLEGSAVKEPDPLDMSEEAKAERWFKRVAQIKDISELSNIPDEDFPTIMPMRKGVNRFVVSKRKTPLERRLTSPQYRRNLPTVSSDPVKDGDSS